MPGQHRIDWEAAKTRTDAIVPWITVFGLIAGGVYSLVEYRNHERDRRIEATMAYVTRYMAPPLSDYRAVLVKRWQAHEADLLAVLKNSSLTPAELNRQYSAGVLAMVTADELALPIQETVLFFEQLANCVTLKLCESDAVNSMLAGQAQEFLHQYYPYVCHLRQEWNDPAIARQLEQVFNAQSMGKDICR
jgi:hypothetical protein